MADERQAQRDAKKARLWEMFAPVRERTEAERAQRRVTREAKATKRAKEKARQEQIERERNADATARQQLAEAGMSPEEETEEHWWWKKL